jgi:hypothetical protein
MVFKNRETQNYALSLGTSQDSGNACYQITNKDTGVVEIETYLLPQAIKQLPELQAALDAITAPGFMEA